MPHNPGASGVWTPSAVLTTSEVGEVLEGTQPRGLKTTVASGGRTTSTEAGRP